MRKYLLSLLLICITGCGSVPSSSPYTYTGISSYWKQVSGHSNFRKPYKEPPVLNSDSLFDRELFEEEVAIYFEGAKNDLTTIKNLADNAKEKIDAAIDSVNRGSYFNFQFIVSTPSPVFGKSNFELFSEYPEFPDLNHRPPLDLFDHDERFAQQYRMEMADYRATVRAYVEDGRHYLLNCQNDLQEILGKVKQLQLYIESLPDDN